MRCEYGTELEHHCLIAWNVIEDAIEERCEAEDAERRRVAAQGAASLARRTRVRR
jgi:hypothetical protein